MSENKTFQIKELSELTGVKTGTIRFYEKCGFMESVERLPNGYRVFHRHHYYQVRICRLVFGGFVNKRLRKISMNVIAAASEWNLARYEKAVREYADAIEMDIFNTKKAIAAAEEYIGNYSSGMHCLSEESREEPQGFTGQEEIVRYSKKQAANLLGITPETIRNWERNGLLAQKRAYEKRYYDEQEINRMRIIRLLLDTGYSIMSIRAFLMKCEQGRTTEATEILWHPQEGICVQV